VHLTSGINFHYHGGEFIETQSASGATRRYVHGPGIDEPLVWYEGAGTNDRRYLHADERGSIVAVSDNSGNVIGINKYDEYGVPAATNIGSFGYTGQVWLPELGLWHYKERMYDPRLGRFLQPDPIGYDDGMNMYAYVGGDPVNFTDSTGLSVDVRVPTMYRADPFTGSSIFVIGNPCRLRNYCQNSGDFLAMNTASHALPGLNKREFNSTGAVDEQVHPDIVVTGRRKPTRPPLLVRIIRAAGGALDRLAGRIKPPEGRKPNETFSECFNRIAGMSPALGVVGAASVAAGGPWLGYPRGGIAGGGRGSSLISYAARGSLGSKSLGARVFGTGNLGGAVGRGLSKASAGGGAAAAGWAAGTALGASQICQ
jgi:RHS repeat-associated protein